MKRGRNMKTKKALSIMVALILVVASLAPISAMAINRPFNFEFNSTIGNKYTDNYTKSDSDQHWYVRVYNNGINNVSSANILGVKMHHLQSVGYVSNYETITDYVSHTFNYTTSVPYSNEDYFFMGAKKDSDSTSSATLIVTGVFCP